MFVYNELCSVAVGGRRAVRELRELTRSLRLKEKVEMATRTKRSVQSRKSKVESRWPRSIGGKVEDKVTARQGDRHGIRRAERCAGAARCPEYPLPPYG